MNQEEFNKLPGLLTRKLFMNITGLRKEHLRELVLQKKIRYLSLGHGKGKYYKGDAARFGGFKL